MCGVMNKNTTRTLANLALGLRTDAAHMKDLEHDLAEALRGTRLFGAKYGTPDISSTNWQDQWDNVEARLTRVRLLVNEMHDCIECQDTNRLKQAFEAWETIQAEDIKLVTALGSVRSQVGSLDALARKEWNLIALKLELPMEAIHACAKVLRIKLELLKQYSKTEVEALVQEVLSKREREGESNAARYQQEFDDAALEIENEQHEYLGFIDVVKSLFMRFESA